MKPDLWSLYREMHRSRVFEMIVAQLWKEGLISGEMHLGTGEEAIVAGVLAHIRDGDALALDHRGTPPLITRGVDPVLIINELLGFPDGLCRGRAGHMHLMSREHLAVASGIVGASGPAAAGFALAAQSLRAGALAVSFFGEGALNQGMMMESMNLASVWNLPVLFVCKDDNWSITASSDEMTGGNIRQRVVGLGLSYTDVDGSDVAAVWDAAGRIIEGLRSASGPALLRATCSHLNAHFLGDQLMRIKQAPLKELPPIARPLLWSVTRVHGGPVGDRLAGLRIVLRTLVDTWRDPRERPRFDPVLRLRTRLADEPERLAEIENAIEREMTTALARAMGSEPA